MNITLYFLTYSSLKYLNRTTKKDIFKKGIIMSFKSDLQQVENYIEQLKAIIKANANDDNIYEDFEDKDYQTIYEKLSSPYSVIILFTSS